MKKFLAGIIAVLIVLGMTVSVSATETDNESTDGSVDLVDNSSSTLQNHPALGSASSSSENKTMTVEIKVEDSYAVTIPASVSLTESSGKYVGSETISASPNLVAGKKLNISVLSSGWLNAIYYDMNGDPLANSGIISKAEYKVASDGALKNVTFFLSKGENTVFNYLNKDPKEILILSTSGTADASASLNFTAESESALPAGTHSYSQTFKIWFEES